MNTLTSKQIESIKKYWMEKNMLKSRTNQLFDEIKNGRKSISTDDTNLQNSFRELTSTNTHGIKSAIYWLEMHFNENTGNGNEKIKDIYNLLLDADKKLNEAFYKFDNIFNDNYDKNDEKENEIDITDDERENELYNEIDKINIKICTLNDEYEEMLSCFGLSLYNMDMDLELFEFINNGIF